MLDAIIQSWAGTPYMLYQKRKRVAVDCLYFVEAVLEEYLGIPHARPEARADDMLRMVRRLGLTKGPLSPASIVRVHEHVYIADSQLRLWHAWPGPGVCMAGRPQLEAVCYNLTM